MTQVTITQTRKPGSGALIAFIMLAVLGFTYFGSRLGRIANVQDREREKEARRQMIFNTKPEEYQKIGDAITESKSAEKFLENMKKAIAEKQKEDAK